MSASAARKPAVAFIFVTLVLFVLGFGILIPVIPNLVNQFQGGNVSAASGEYGLLLGAYAAMQFTFSPILGSLSDRFGRKRVLLIALAGSAIDYVVMGLAPNMSWLFVARMISGATAGALATCNAYIADVTPPEKRAQAYGLLGAAFGIGFVLGPAIGGFLAEGGHLHRPFFFAAGCVAVNCLYGIFFLPESLPVENRRPFSWKRANPIGSLLALRRFRGVFDLALVYFIYTFAQYILQSIWILYTETRYHWTVKQAALSMTYVGAITAVVQGGLIKRIIAVTGDRKALVIGLLISAAAMVCYGLATEGWMIYALVCLGCFGGIAQPASQALVTRHVPPDEQGGLQGSLSGLLSLSLVGAPIVGSYSFGLCIGPGARWNLPGVAFFEAALLMLVAIALAYRSFVLDDRLETQVYPAPAAEKAG